MRELNEAERRTLDAIKDVHQGDIVGATTEQHGAVLVSVTHPGDMEPIIYSVYPDGDLLIESEPNDYAVEAIQAIRERLEGKYDVPPVPVTEEDFANLPILDLADFEKSAEASRSKFELKLVTIKLPRNPNHDPHNKVTGPCPVSGVCTDSTGEHHTILVVTQAELDAVLAKFDHITRIETVGA